MHLDIVKAQGTGNDFVIVEDTDDALADIFDTAIVEGLCDRRFGVGADGFIRVAPGGPDRVFMDYRNADGSLAEMCGNGVRCLAKYCFDRGILSGSDADIETRAGLRHVTVHRDGAGQVHRVDVDMGRPELSPGAIPADAPGPRALELPVRLDGETVVVAAVGMGNPHAVIFVDDVDVAPVTSLGPRVERSETYPHGANVGFAHVVSDSRIRLRVWERGSGETLACGTGACAAVVAAAETGRSGRAVTVDLPGGELAVRYDATVTMSGPAVEVFTARVDLEAVTRAGHREGV